MFLTRDGKPVASIVLKESSPVLEFAAVELRDYVAKMSSATLQLERAVPTELKGRIVLATRSGAPAMPGLPP